MNIGTFVQGQWFRRSADEKFADVETLAATLRLRKENSVATPVKMSNVEFTTRDGQLVLVDTKNDTDYSMTNWAFSQVAHLVDAHPSYLSKLPADLSARCLNHGFQQEAVVKDKDLELFSFAKDGRILMAMTGGYYGRVWDATVVEAAQEVVARTDGRFYSPLDWSREKRALFSSDRDLTMLFIDGGSLVDAGKTAKGEDDILHRGLLWWNSEVGAGAVKFYTFLFRVVCGNFGIHGIEQVQFTKVRHTINGPARFVTDMLPQVMAYVGASTQKLEETIKKAQNKWLPEDDRMFNEYFQRRQFTKAEIARATQLADEEEGDHRTLWQMYNGFTASARDIQFADKAIVLQHKAGKLLETVAV